MIKKKSTPTRLVLILFFIIIFLGITFLISSSLLQSRNFNVKTKAQTNHCTEGNCLSEPSCCADMIAQQDYRVCPWNENDATLNYRAFCRPETCNQLPPGLTNRGHCGWYWYFHDGYTNRPIGYGCMIGSSEQTMVPICTNNPTQPPNPTNPPQPTSPPPTQPPVPTRTPTPRPTRTPTPRPTSPFPTNTPPLYPTNTPTAPIPTLTFISPSPTTGQFTIPTSPQQQVTQTPTRFPIFNPITVINELVVQPVAQSANKITEIINTQAPKALDFFEYIFERVTYYDFLLEQNINNRLRKLFNR